MSEAIFETLRQSMEKRDRELGRNSPALDLKCDARYYKFANIVRSQLGKEPLTATLSTLTDTVEPKSGQESNDAPLSSHPRGSLPLTSSKPGYATLETREDDDVIDLIDDVILPSTGDSSQSPEKKMNKLPRLFTDDDETLVLDPSSYSQPMEKTVPQNEDPAATASKRKASESEQAPKRRRTKKPLKEVRGDRYRSVPSKWILDRMQRHTQRLCLVRFESCGEDGMHFDIMGTNGNIYAVNIGLHPTCTCPDFTGRSEKGKHGPCKHLIFVFLRVFKLEREDPRWWQTRLVKSELSDMLEHRPAHLGDGVMADKRAQRQLAAVHAQESGDRRPIEGDCPVCYEYLLDDGARPENVTTFCKKCGNNFHKVCLDKWIQAQAGTPTCPMCRQTLVSNGNNEKASYVNLAAYSAAHERTLTLAEMYRDTHQYIGSAGRGRRGGRGR